MRSMRILSKEVVMDFDDLDIEEIAFAFGFLETQVEGEREEREPEEPLTFEEMVSTGDEMLDKDDVCRDGNE